MKVSRFPNTTAIGLLLSSLFLPCALLASPAVKKPLWVDGELIVTFAPAASTAGVSRLLGGMQLKSLHQYHLVKARHLKLPANLSVKAAIQALAKNPLVKAVQPNYLYYTSATPNDTFLPAQWGANNIGQLNGTFDADMDLTEAWDITTGSSDVVVAVLDSGTSLTHPDLMANIWTNPGEIAGNGIDDDGNGYIDDIHGWDFARNDNNPSPVGGACEGHGTHTAGTIGAVGNNNTGVSGVAWNVKIMPLNTFEENLGIFCTTSDAALLEAIDYYTRMGVRISNNSYGGAGASIVMRNAIRRSKSIFIAAAGNESSNNDTTPSYPANYPLDNIISVAATTQDDLLADPSHSAHSVDVGAPGESIVSTLPGNTYDILSGTSMASPQVAGLAALLLSQDPDLTVRELRWRILNGVDNTSIPVASRGRVNAFNSLQFGLTPPAVSVTISAIGSSDISPGDSLQYHVSLTNNTASGETVKASIYVRAEDGQEATLAGPGILNMTGGETINADLSQAIPANFGAQEIEFFISAETATSLDEAKTVFTVVP